MSNSHSASCPRCNGSIYRVSRRTVDRIMSVFIPVHRYRCSAMGCDWEGNLRVRPSFRLNRGSDKPDDDGDDDAREPTASSRRARTGQWSG